MQNSIDLQDRDMLVVPRKVKIYCPHATDYYRGHGFSMGQQVSPLGKPQRYGSRQEALDYAIKLVANKSSGWKSGSVCIHTLEIDVLDNLIAPSGYATLINTEVISKDAFTQAEIEFKRAEIKRLEKEVQDLEKTV